MTSLSTSAIPIQSLQTGPATIYLNSVSSITLSLTTAPTSELIILPSAITVSLGNITVLQDSITILYNQIGAQVTYPVSVAVVTTTSLPPTPNASTTTTPISELSSASPIPSVHAPTTTDPLPNSRLSKSISTTFKSRSTSTTFKSTATHASASHLTHSTIAKIGGAAAGFGILCFLIGAAIGVWFAWRKSKHSKGLDSEREGLTLDTFGRKPSNRFRSIDPGSTLDPAFHNILPQPLEDKAISEEVSKISNLIKNHVQSYYHSGRVSAVYVDNEDLQALGSGLPISTTTLSRLLEKSANREIALRLCIAWVVVSGMQGNVERSNSFLPAGVIRCLQEFKGSENEASPNTSGATQWRILTTKLIRPTYVRSPFTSSDSRNPALQAAVSALDNILQNFADLRMDNEQRKRNLEELIKRSALFAFTLFSQPSCWEFDWKIEKSARSEELCVFPALVQVIDECGEPVIPPRPFSEAVIRLLNP